MLHVVTDFSFQIAAVRLDATFPGRLVDIVRPYATADAERSLATNARLPGYASHARATYERGGRIEWARFETTDARGFRREWQRPTGQMMTTSPFTAPPADRLNDCDQFIARVGWGDAYERSPLAKNIVVNLQASLCSISVTANDAEVEQIGVAVKALIEEYVSTDLLTRMLPFKVFIGHGGDRKWEAVRDFVKAEGYETVSFESDDRVGKATLEVVEQMITESSVAVVLMTGVDRLEDGRLLARQNVIHEIGFAHGRLGSRNTIVLLEAGTEEFSNIAGITQIRFRTGEVHTTRSELLACIANRRRDRLMSATL